MPLGPAPKDLRGCSVEACTRPLVARGLCAFHYQNAYRHKELPPKQDRSVPKVSVKAWVPVTLEQMLRVHSRRTGRTHSELLRAALEEFLQVHHRETGTLAAMAPNKL